MYRDPHSGLRFSHLIFLGGQPYETWRLGRFFMRHGVQVSLCTRPDEAEAISIAPADTTLVVIAEETAWRHPTVLQWLRNAPPDLCVLSMAALLRRLGLSRSPLQTQFGPGLAARLYEAQSAGPCEVFVRNNHRQGRILFARSRVVWMTSNVPGLSFRQNVSTLLGLTDAQVRGIIRMSQDSGNNVIETLIDQNLVSTSQILACLRRWFVLSLQTMLGWKHSASACSLRSWWDLSMFSFDLSELLILATTTSRRAAENNHRPALRKSGFRPSARTRLDRFLEAQTQTNCRATANAPREPRTP